MIDSLKYCQENKNLIIYGYVIISNHLHLIIQSGNSKLSDIIRDFKTHTSKKIIETIQVHAESRREWLLMLFKEAAKRHKQNFKYQVSKHDNHPIELLSNKFIDQKLDYIHMNPVRAYLVQNAEDYLYSSARQYAGFVGFLDITWP